MLNFIANYLRERRASARLTAIADEYRERINMEDYHRARRSLMAWTEDRRGPADQTWGFLEKK